MAIRKYIKVLALLYPMVILSIIASLFIVVLPLSMFGRFLFVIYFYLLAWFFKNKKAKVFYVKTVYVISLFLVFFESAYILIYNTKITRSAAYILIETNSNEALEYLSEYFNKEVLVLLLILVVPSIFILKNINKILFNKQANNSMNKVFENNIIKGGVDKDFWNKALGAFWKKQLARLFLFSVCLVLLLKNNLYTNSLAFNLYLGYIEYKEETNRYKQYFSENANSSFLKSVKLKTDKNNETLIITIGESTTRYNLGIYGYSRNTTPNLDKLKDELIIFKDVISPYSNTIPVLEKVLTFGSVQNPELIRMGTIIQLLKAAGYKTYWISNQAPIGQFETRVTMLAKASDFVYYTNVIGSEVNSISLDQLILPVLKNVLNEDVSKKVIFVHLMGTHTRYSNRYPKEFEIFKDKPKTNYLSETSRRVINEYDNAVFYNDYIIYNIIKLLKNSNKVNEMQQLLYFSDHGEEVFRTMDFYGHSNEVGTYPMYEIPFLYWSNSVLKLSKYKNYTDRKYMTDDLIYSVVDVLDIKFEGMKYEKSLFNDSFKSSKRIVNGKINFDTELKN